MTIPLMVAGKPIAEVDTFRLYGAAANMPVDHPVQVACIAEIKRRGYPLQIPDLLCPSGARQKPVRKGARRNGE